MILPVQLKMARAALDLGVRDVSKLSGISANTISRYENGSDARGSTLRKIQSVLEEAGIEFLDENGGGPGVRLRRPDQ
jgi:transcriptional regulator with XRE-family HTH domain